MLAQDIIMVHDTQETIEYIQVLIEAYKGILTDAKMVEDMAKVFAITKQLELLEKNLTKEYAKQEKAYHNLLVMYL